MLQYSFTWKQLSAVAGVSFWNIYFKLVQGAVRAPEVVAFLKALRRHLGDRKLLIVWDRLQAHRSRLVREYVESQEGAIHLEYLPPYAPELNPVEYLWAHWKHHELANFCPKDFAELGSLAFSKLLLTQANVAVSPGLGFGEHGDAHVRIALVENKHRIRQAIRNIRQVMADPSRSIDLYLRGVGDNITPLKARA